MDSSNLDYGTAHQPDELPPSAKLQAGYVRYIRFVSEEGPNGEICFETCIRRSLADNHDRYDSSGSHFDDGNGILKRQSFYYSAISYAWGDPTLRHPIIVDGHSRLVANNLWDFLQLISVRRADLQGARLHHDKRMRRYSKALDEDVATIRAFGRDPCAAKPSTQPSEEQMRDRQARLRASIEASRKRIQRLLRANWRYGWLWIDALCIDQSDAGERTHQVKIMSNIFKEASQVIAWLGPAYDSSEHAMVAISEYTDRPAIDDSLRSPETLSEAICSLCERPYWKRLWVFQELRHARHISIMCGESNLSWSQFKTLQQVIEDLVKTSVRDLRWLRESLATRMIEMRTREVDTSLWNLLWETRNLECADQRDRVYALLSVATEGHENVEADYTRTKPMDFNLWLLLVQTRSLESGNQKDGRRPLFNVADEEHANTQMDFDTFVQPIELAHQILRNEYAVRPPVSLAIVLQDCRFLEQVFRMTKDSINCYWDSHRDRHKCVDNNSFPLDLSWFAWAKFHHHPAVSQLVLKKRQRYSEVSDRDSEASDDSESDAAVDSDSMDGPVDHRVFPRLPYLRSALNSRRYRIR